MRVLFLDPQIDPDAHHKEYGDHVQHLGQGVGKGGREIGLGVTADRTDGHRFGHDRKSGIETEGGDDRHQDVASLDHFLLLCKRKRADGKEEGNEGSVEDIPQLAQPFQKPSVGKDSAESEDQGVIEKTDTEDRYQEGGPVPFSAVRMEELVDRECIGDGENEQNRRHSRNENTTHSTYLHSYTL